MPKAGDLNWDHLMKTGHAEQDPLTKSVQEAFGNKSTKDSNKGGEKVTKEELRKEALDIVRQAHTGPGRQPTDEEMFGHLVATEEQIKKAEDDWNNTFNKHFDALSKPVDDQNSKETQDWGSRGSVLDELSEEERVKWNMNTDD